LIRGGVVPFDDARVQGRITQSLDRFRALYPGGVERSLTRAGNGEIDLVQRMLEARAGRGYDRNYRRKNGTGTRVLDDSAMEAEAVNR
jgi:hypothetical protein